MPCLFKNYKAPDFLLLFFEMKSENSYSTGAASLPPVCNLSVLRFYAGQKFASMEMKTLVSRVLRNYKLESMYHRDKVQAVAELVLRARNGLRIRLIPREQ